MVTDQGHVFRASAIWSCLTASLYSFAMFIRLFVYEIQPCKDAQNRLLWGDKTCQSWKAFLLSFSNNV